MSKPTVQSIKEDIKDLADVVQVLAYSKNLSDEELKKIRSFAEGIIDCTKILRHPERYNVK